ncbi:serine/threonine-protein phosphatase 6 regulatory ankyrin repeat subunit B-like [Haliotis cracherodii]|uniref:serine/threonine-protein phosphatase 6 regulatory ankyrin repeat subunit B-like n=1 Tax=Haliotis cracherodii TaxID=6455 RepID=UPI0039EC3995
MLRPSTVLCFTFLIHAVAACEWGKHGENCDKRCSENCQVNPQRNLTHCNKETGECSDGCITGWYDPQCDQHCSKNCLDNVCNHGNGHCTRGCSGNQIGDFCEVTEGATFISTDVKVKTNETTGLSTVHVAVIITISLVAIIVIIVVTVVIKRRRQTDNRRKSTRRPKAGADPENPEGEPLLPRGRALTTSNDQTEDECAGVMERGMLEWEIQKTEELFEETAIYNKVKERLENFRHVTISGASGEGKTSMALKLGSEYQKKGYELYFVNSISEFKLCSERKGKNMCFIFDDIFGTVGISTDSPHLRRILGILNSWLEQMTSDFFKPYRSNEKLNSHSAHRETNMGNVHVIFTTKSYNLELGKLHLVENECEFFKGDSVIDLTQTESHYTVEEKKQMFIKHKKHNSNFSFFDLDKICGIKDQLFGFPLTCKLFFSFPQSHDQYEDFFKTPLTYLRAELESLLKKGNNKSAALILMLLCEGNLNLCHLESGSQTLEKHLSTVSGVVGGVDRAKVISCVKGFFGTIFTKADNTSFSHPAIYDACAFVYCKINCAFVLQHCSIHFLYERVQAQTVPACETDEDRHVIYVSDAYNDIIASRLAGAVREGNYRMSIMHPILERHDIVDKILAELKPTRTDISVTDEHGNTMFHYACYSGNVYLVRQLLPLCDINSRGAEGVTPARIAVLHGLEDLFKLLVSKGADLKLTDDYNDTLLHLACKGGNRSIVEQLLPLFDIKSRGQHGRTALMRAALYAKKDTFDLLVSKGADLKLTDDYNDTVLHLACEGGNRSIVEHILTLFDINSRGQYDRTALMVAAMCAKKDVVDLLVSNGADITLNDDENNNVLQLACQGGNRSIVEYLLPLFDINSRGQHGRTAVMRASLFAKRDIFDLLVSKGADLTLTDDYNDAVLHLACEGGSRSIVEHLLTLFDINSRGQYDRTALMVAAMCAKKDVVDLLVSNGADITLTDDFNNNVLQLACKGGNRSIVECLLPLFDINSRGQHGRTALMRAALFAKKDIFDLLVSKGADLTLTDEYNNNVLQLACQGGNRSIVEQILPLFDINSRGQHSWTAVMWAAVCAKKDAFDLLVSKGADLTLTDDDNNNVLYLACKGGNRSIVEHLLTLFDINSRGKCDRTVLMVAAVCAKKDVVDLLLSNGADITLTDDYNNNVLYLACQSGNRSIVECLLPLFDINSQGQYGWTALMWAAVCEKKDAFEIIVSKGADITLTDDFNNNVLHLACRGGNRSIVEYLLPLFDINSRGQHGRTALMRAALYAKKDIFDLLVSKGADHKLTDDYNDTVLHLACEGGNRSIVEHLLTLFDINSRGQYDRTALMVAAVCAKKDVVDLLVSKGADLTLTDDYNNNVLHLACQSGNRSIVEQLLPLFDINSRGQHGWTAVMGTAVFAKKDTFDLLVSKGADLTLTDGDNDNVLHLACEGGNILIVEHLLPMFDINCRGYKGWTPVMKGAYSGKKDTFQMLLSKGANPSLTGDDNGTLLHAASRGGNIDIVRHVIADFDLNTRGWNGHTPLMLAVCGGHTDVVDFLVEHGADVNMVDNDGDTLLHLACESGNLTMVKHVMSYSDINLRDNFGWTPLAMAAVEGKFAVFKYLKGLGADLTLTDRAGDDVYTLALQGGCRGIIKELGREEHSDKSITPWNQLMKSLVTSQMFYLNTHSQQSPGLVQTDQYGDSLLHLACRGGNIQCVEYLLPSYDINVRGRYNWTPVMMAAVCGHEDVFQLLVSHKADLSLVSNKGEGITTLARRGNNDDIVQYLNQS